MKNYQHYLKTLDKKIPDWTNPEDIINLVFPGYCSYELSSLNFSGLTCYFHQDINWICTDTQVGLRFYFLDGEFLMCSYQRGRKCDEEFEFVSNEMFLKLRDYILKQFNKMETEIKIINPKEDWSDFEKHP